MSILIITEQLSLYLTNQQVNPQYKIKNNKPRPYLHTQL